MDQPLSTERDEDDDHHHLEGSKKEEEKRKQKLSNSPNDGTDHGGDSQIPPLQESSEQPRLSESTEGDHPESHGSVHTDESGRSVDEGDTNGISSFLSRNLRLIEYFYLSKASEATSSPDSELQLKFNWLRDDGKGEKLEEESSTGSEIGGKNKRELENKIIGLIQERQREMAEARKEGKFSYIEWLIRDRGVGGLAMLNVIHAKVNEIGNLLCCHLCDLLFVVSEDWGQYGKCSYFKSLLKLLMKNQGKTIAIKRIISVIEVAEKEFLRNGKHMISEILEGSSEGQDDNEGDLAETQIDHILDMFLKEVLCLESILSYPNLSQEKDLEAVLSGLDVCKKEVDKIGSLVTALKTIHLSIFENTGEDLVMEQFQIILKDAIDSWWERLDEQEDDNS
ncbi:hypothetical protein TorRG33x02_248310 [Trema orientale]|uniref:Uncharacterized protein n=1 Tax=Trema orientale TaxID=63057 RepID=A0A2P5DLA1_TREOI|nr:hypothetical protein TorRG33x02_248310 [Trema orientale]